MPCPLCNTEEMLNPPEPQRENFVVNSTLFDGELLQIGYVEVRPARSAPGDIEHAQRHVLALPLAGLFAKHDGPRRAVLATPGHALLIEAGRPYRLSFPGCRGDRCLVLRLTSEGLSRAMPEVQSGDGFDAAAFAPHAPLPSDVMLARSRLFSRLRRGDLEPLEAEEDGLRLLAAALAAARRQPLRGRTASTDGARRVRHVQRTQEAVWTNPEQPWSLAALAAQASVSASHLAHAFRAETGSTVYGYVLRSRLARALDAVLDSDAALTAIALDTGFSSHSHFTARFRAYFGHTPVALRQAATAGSARELRRNMTAQRAQAA